MMAHDPTAIDLRAIETETFVASSEWHPTLGSTNDHARAMILADTDIVCPHLIGTDQQSAGRGRGANRWWAAQGALSLSLIVRASDHVRSSDDWPPLSLTVGAALCTAIETYIGGDHSTASFDVRLKWPNDVYLNEKKLAGVLIEIPRPKTALMIIGIGINANNQLIDAPPELQQTATSLRDALGKPVDRTAVLIDIFQQLARDLQSLGDGGEPAAALRRRWRQQCLLTGRTVTIDDNTHQATGTVVGIDDDGALLLQAEAGISRIVGGRVVAF